MRTEPFQRPGYLALIQLLRTTDTIWNSSRAFFETWGISPSQFNVLNLLYGNQNGQSQTQLSEELIVHRSNITGLVDRLERLGWVERNEVEGDRRKYQVRLTEQGNALMRELLPHYFAAAEKLWEGIPEERIIRLTNDLATAATNSQRIVVETAHAKRTRRLNHETSETIHRHRDQGETGTKTGRKPERGRKRFGSEA